MAEDLLPYIGHQIKHYRKARGMTIGDLAQKIHKSKGSVSKYENGQIAIDVGTLFEIATALEISPRYLIDYPAKTSAIPKNSRGPFGDVSTLYLYHARGNAIFKSIIKMSIDIVSNKVEATLFYVVEDLDSPYNCACIYTGEMHRHDTVLCFTLQNAINPVENLLLNFSIPVRNVSTLAGLISGLGASTLAPACFLGILSPVPLAETEELKGRLAFPRDALADAKKRNILTLAAQNDEV
ncbi:helix-turn-helix domain-containing protein [Ruminococcaceae bacterium OttesenSCG-928-A11]|nr:helix-turn-helix domain-containing protein [Ruminococcaceae bacterium OttesenSCG-928-A11]